jgi:hypothetical protein
MLLTQQTAGVSYGRLPTAAVAIAGLIYSTVLSGGLRLLLVVYNARMFPPLVVSSVYMWSC